MRQMQWHLKQNWRVPESLEKVIPVSRSLHPHLRWWLEESNVLQGQPIPSKTCSAIVYRCIKRRLGRSLKQSHCKGNLVPARKQATHKLPELMAVFLDLKEFQNLCKNNIVLIAMDNTTVVAHINRGGMKSDPLCVLLWRILTWCTSKQVTLRAQHIPGQLNMVADKLSRLGQSIQTDWSLLPEVFQAICNRWHRPK